MADADVADLEEQVAVRQDERVVPVAADGRGLPERAVHGGDVDAGEVRDLLREQRRLEDRGGGAVFLSQRCTVQRRAGERRDGREGGPLVGVELARLVPDHGERTGGDAVDHERQCGDGLDGHGPGLGHQCRDGAGDRGAGREEQRVSGTGDDRAGQRLVEQVATRLRGHPGLLRHRQRHEVAAVAVDHREPHRDSAEAAPGDGRDGVGDLDGRAGRGERVGQADEHLAGRQLTGVGGRGGGRGLGRRRVRDRTGRGEDGPHPAAAVDRDPAPALREAVDDREAATAGGRRRRQVGSAGAVARRAVELDDDGDAVLEVDDLDVDAGGVVVPDGVRDQFGDDEAGVVDGVGEDAPADEAATDEVTGAGDGQFGGAVAAVGVGPGGGCGRDDTADGRGEPVDGARHGAVRGRESFDGHRGVVLVPRVLGARAAGGPGGCRGAGRGRDRCETLGGRVPHRPRPAPQNLSTTQDLRGLNNNFISSAVKSSDVRSRRL